MIRIGFGGIVYYTYNKEPPQKNSFGNYSGPYGPACMNLGVRIRGSVGDIEFVNMVPFQGLRRVLSLILPGRILNFSLAELEAPNKHKHSIIGRLHYKSFFVCMMSIFAFSSITIISAIVVNTIDINKIVRWRARVFFFVFFVAPFCSRPMSLASRVVFCCRRRA